jgi:hypothetical protein
MLDFGTVPVWARLSDAEFKAMYFVGSRPRPSVLHRVLARALLPCLREFPSEEQLRAKPLLLKLQLPLPPSLRCYLFQATQHESERQMDTFRVQLTAGEPASYERMVFSREGGVRPVLMGFDPRLEVFIIWDADVNDDGGGFKFSQGVQVPPTIVYHAAASGISEGVRNVRRAARQETIVAVRADRLVDGLLRRIELSNRALTEYGNAD